MSLSSQLQPIEPPENGLADVKRRSQQRARRYRVASGFASIASSFLIIGVAVLVAPGHNGSTVSDDTTSITTPTSVGGVGGVTQPSGNSTGSLTSDPNFSDVHPDSAGLPGGTVATSVVAGVVYYGTLLAIPLAFIGLIWSVVSVRREPSPSLRPRGFSLVCLTAGPVICLLLAIFLLL